MKKNLYIFLLFAFTTLLASMQITLAADKTAQQTSNLITTDSIGFVQIGEPLKQVEKEAKKLGYSIDEKHSLYTVFDENDKPLLQFTVFTEHKRAKPIRTIKTSSDRFIIQEGVSLLGTGIEQLSNYYGKPSVFRVTNKPASPEIVQFENWPFKDSVVKGKFMIKYEANLDCVINEYGKVFTSGIYPNDFAWYTDEYRPHARIKSFLIEAIEPKVRFD